MAKPENLLQDAEGHPICPYCKKKLGKSYISMYVKKDEIPTIFRSKDPLGKQGYHEDCDGRKILKIHKRRISICHPAANRIQLQVNPKDPYDVKSMKAVEVEPSPAIEEITCWLGEYSVVYGYFCKNDCASRFGRASYNGGMRMADKK